MTRKYTVHPTIKRVFTLFGMWPGASYIFIFRAYWIISLTTDEFCHYWYFRSHLKFENLPILIDCMSSFMAHMKVISKMLVFWFNKKKFIKILKMITEDWSECANNDNDMRETASKAKLTDRITLTMFIVHIFTCITYSISVFMADVDINDTEADLPFLMKMQFPMRISSMHIYRLLLSAQFVHLLFIVIFTGLVNALLLTLVFHLGGQINILRSWFAQLASKKNEGTHESVTLITTKIIRKHQRIIQFSTHIENLYKYISLVMFASNTTMICMLAFLVVISLGDPDAAERVSKYLLFYLITNLESFIYCFAGEYLKNKSKLIGTAAYDSAWYNMKPEESRLFLFIILRAQKHLTLTAGKIMELSLESFGNTMKASASYISVLLAM